MNGEADFEMATRLVLIQESPYCNLVHSSKCCMGSSVLTHPSRWSAVAFAGYTTVSNCTTIQYVEGLLCVM